MHKNDIDGSFFVTSMSAFATLVSILALNGIALK